MICELLSKDIKLGILDITGDSISINSIQSDRLNYIRDINKWIVSRLNPVTRDNIRKLLKLAGLASLEEYIKTSYSMSLTDTIWVKPLTDTITWDEVNPYQNSLSNIISEAALNRKYIDRNLRIPSPDYTVDGSTDKCWIREQGITYLYKTMGEKFSGISGNRPYCEYYASQVAHALISDKSHFISYDIEVAKTPEGYNKAYCICPAFTSLVVGYLPYEDSIYKGCTLAELDEQLDSMRDRQIIREMLLLDSLILNYDRHMGNYGFLIDNDTFKVKGMAPIFDQDCSLGNLVSLQSVKSYNEAYEQALQLEPRTEMGSYLDQAKWALTKELRQRLIEMYPFHFVRIRKDRDLDDMRITFMEYIVNTQIRRILQS